MPGPVGVVGDGTSPLYFTMLPVLIAVEFWLMVDPAPAMQAETISPKEPKAQISTPVLSFRLHAPAEKRRLIQCALTAIRTVGLTHSAGDSEARV